MEDELPETPPPGDENILPATPPPISQIDLCDTPPPKEHNSEEIPDTPPPANLTEEGYDSFDEIPTDKNNVQETDSFDEFEPSQENGKDDGSSSSSSASSSDSDFEPNEETKVAGNVRSSKRIRTRFSNYKSTNRINNRAALDVRQTISVGEFLTEKPGQRILGEEQRMKWAKMVQPPREVLEALIENYGHREFREKQWDVVRNVLSRNDQFVLMSTGYGKSVCYQLPSLLLNSMTLVISPLISLMNDQVTTLVAKGIEAVKLDGDSSISDWGKVMSNSKNIRFLYMSPELATSQKGIEVMVQCREYLTLIAIDEAHCVSQWGHDFRSSYRHLAIIRRREELARIPMIALTATATSRVRDDVIQNLNLKNPRITLTSFDRKNLFISVHEMKSIVTDLDPFLKIDEVKGKHFGGPTIIYCQTKQLVDDINSALRRFGVRSSQYHAGMTKTQREKAHMEFMRDKITTIVATVAFGMGIDKPDVRNVIHYGCPKDIESYYQEMGRAGRDGSSSVCRVFWAPKDIVMNKNRIRNSQLPEPVVENLLGMMRQLELVLSTQGCRRFQLLKHFDASATRPVQPQSDCCDRCSALLSGSSDTGFSTAVNVGTEARWILTVIRELYDGRTGITKPIEFIRGSSKEEWRIKLPKHKVNFGIGKAMNEKYWKALATTLRLSGYLEEVKPNFSGTPAFRFGSCIGLTAAANKWLDSNHKELLVESNPVLMQAKGGVKNNANSSKSGNSSVTFVEKKILGSSKKRIYKSASEYPQLCQKQSERHDNESDKVIKLRAQLDDLRVELANMFEVAPFQIVSNSVLDCFAKYRPDSVSKLDVINGMSMTQKERYGKRFVDCVVAFANETGISLNFDHNSAIPDGVTRVMENDLTEAVKRIYLSHVMNQFDTKQVASCCGISEGTVFSYLSTAVEKGLPIHLNKLNITEEMINKLYNVARNSLGSNVARMAPWMEAVPSHFVDYNRLRIVRAILIFEYGIDIEGNENSEVKCEDSVKPINKRSGTQMIPETCKNKKFKL